LRLAGFVRIGNVNSRNFFREHVRGRDIVYGAHSFSRFDLPVKLSDYVFDLRRSVLENPVTLAMIAGALTAFGNFSRRRRADIVPVTITIDQPAEPNLRIVEKILAPKILRAVDRNATRHRADNGHFAFRNFSNRSQRNQRLKRLLPETLEKTQLALIDVEQ
jgi:hypothetical protein